MSGMVRTDSATITVLLERYDEFADPRQAGNGGNKTGLALMPHAKHCAIHHTYLRPDGQPDVSRIPTSQTGIGLYQACTCHLAQYQEIDRLLQLMHNDRQHPLIATSDGKVSLRSLHWHVRERYLRCETTVKQVRFVRGREIGVVTGSGAALKVYPLAPHQQTVIGKSVNWEAALQEQRHKRSATPTDIRVLVASWNPAVRMQKVRLGVDFIADSWALKDAPAVPADKLVAA